MPDEKQDRIPDKSWSISAEQVLDELGSNPKTGLSGLEVEKRLLQFGKNQITVTETESAWSVFSRQFKNLMVVFLAIATVLSIFLSEYLEAIAIVVVILINVFLGFYTELKAIRSMEALKKLTSMETKVLRNGEQQIIDIENLVPGDIVLLEGGDLVSADMRILDLSRLQVNESTLTGESLPFDKSLALLDEHTILAERRNMLYRGTAITRGSALAIVTATGMDTELGQIAHLVAESIEEEQTPLEERMLNLGKRLMWLTLFVALLVIAMGIMTGITLWLMVQTGIALAVATIPEGLPVVATIALARGMWRMAKRNALINRLSAVETLGATAIICTDKTGTLTENRMTVSKLMTSSLQLNAAMLAQQVKNPEVVAAVHVALLCNNAHINGMGDPLEVALLQAGRYAGYNLEDINKNNPRLDEFAFDAELRLMATLNKGKDGNVLFVKGAPESILEKCRRVLVDDEITELKDSDYIEWERNNREMAESGLRVIALAKFDNAESLASVEWDNLIFIGLMGLLDPPRADVKQSIHRCHDAGMNIIMVTGDQMITARNIAYETCIVTERNSRVINGDELEDLLGDLTKNIDTILASKIFSRVSPAQKLQLVDLYQDQGYVVAMTGDGVNDAPALKKADIGIAMGQRGTQVARDASDMVLKDDSFATIAMAVEQGRIIFNNLRRFVIYLLSCNLSEVLLITLATILGLPLPLLPLQILFLNLVTDVFPALALGVCEGDKSIMQQQPRPRSEGILTNRHWLLIVVYGVLLTMAVFILYLLALKIWQLPIEKVITISFMTLAFAQLFHVFNMREIISSAINNDVVTSKYIWLALITCIVLLLGAIELPGVSDALKLISLSTMEWIWVIAISALPTVVIQIVMLFLKSRYQLRVTGFAS